MGSTTKYIFVSILQYLNERILKIAQHLIEFWHNFLKLFLFLHKRLCSFDFLQMQMFLIQL